MTAPDLVNRNRLACHRARAGKRGIADFLHREARVEVEDRRAMVNRPFTDVGIVTGHPALWSDWFPEATVVADEDVLGLGEMTCDLVVHAMSLHWANDPVGQIIQCRRALRPDGLFMAVFPGGQTLNELRTALAQAETEVSAGLSPRVLPMGEIRDVGALLQRAGLALPVADSFTLNATYETLFHLVRDLRDMGETNAMTAANTRTARRALFERAAQIYTDNFADGDRVRATFELICLTGWAPDDSQPKPLRPGSAQARLADALKVDEMPLSPNDPDPED